MNNEKKKQYIKRLEIVLNLFIAENQEDFFMEVPVSEVARWFSIKQRDVRNLSIIAHYLSPFRIVSEMIEKIEESEEKQSPYVNGATLAIVEEYGNIFVQLFMMSNPEVAIKRIFKVVGAKEDKVKSVLRDLFEK